MLSDHINSFLGYVVPEIGATLIMLFLSAGISVIIGMALAVVITITKEGNLMPHPLANKVLSTIMNIVMSFPFIILAVALIPLTKLVVGTTIGPIAAIIPLSIAETPYIAKLFCDSLISVDKWVIEGAKSFGASRWQLIIIMIHEAVPNLISDITTTAINILNDTSMMGAIGAGGIGAVALIYGYRKSDPVIIIESVIILTIMVYIIQFVGNAMYRKAKYE